MKIKILTILAVFGFCFAAEAQNFTVGLKGGISATNVSVEDVRNDPWQYRDPENIAGYHVGLFTRFQVLGLFLQPEALLAQTGGRISLFNSQDGASNGSERFNFTRLDVPLMVGYNFLNVARVQVGPVASMLLSARQEGKDINDYMDQSDWGWQAGVGLDISSFTIDLRYERINRDYTNEAQGSSSTLNNQQYLLSVGYKFIK